MGGGGSKPSKPPCEDEKASYERWADESEKDAKAVRELAAEIRDKTRERDDRVATLRRLQREHALMVQRRNDMRAAMLAGIRRQLAENRLELIIDGDEEEKYKYTSHDDSYIMEI